MKRTALSAADGVAARTVRSARTPVQTVPFERHVHLDGCFNFRDLGGYRTADGRWTRPQRLYRADGPHALTAADGDALAALELATVLDLRSPQEVEHRGCYTAALSNVVEYHLPMFDLLPDPDELVDWVDPALVARRYRTMLDEAESTIAEILDVLSDPDACPTLFHCSAGKDRTGIVAAVLLGVLGVPDHVIVTDYTLSATAMHRLVAYYQATYPDAAEQLSRVAPAMVAANPNAMAGLVRGLHRDYGTFDDYASAIGAGDAPRHIRDSLLA